MADFSMADISGLLAATSSTEAKNSTSRKGNTELNMEDFLQLMIVQLTSQTIDDTMDTSEMMNQMVQMQMISAITNLTDASVMGYAASLVGQTVTIGYVEDGNLVEKEIQVMGTGTMNGSQVIFGSDGEYYSLNQIMAVGRLPDENGKYSSVGGSSSENTENKPVEGTGESGETTDKTDETGGTGGVTQPDEGGETSGSTDNSEYNGEAGVPTD